MLYFYTMLKYNVTFYLQITSLIYKFIYLIIFVKFVLILGGTSRGISITFDFSREIIFVTLMFGDISDFSLFFIEHDD